MTIRPVTGSRITLTSPDPSAVSIHKRSKRDIAESDTHEVTFTPHNDTNDDDTIHSSGDYESTKERKIVDEL